MTGKQGNMFSATTPTGAFHACEEVKSERDPEAFDYTVRGLFTNPDAAERYFAKVAPAMKEAGKAFVLFDCHGAELARV